MLGESRQPVGPVTTELLIEGIRAGQVPAETLVCEVGGREWRPVRETAPFSALFGGAPAPAKRRTEPSESTIVDSPLLPQEGKDPQLRHFDDNTEHTIVDEVPRWSEPPG